MPTSSKNQEIRPASRAGQAIIIMSGLVSASIITLALHVLQGILRPFFVAVFLCFLVKPWTSKLGRRAGVFGYAFAIAIIFGIFSLGERVISADLAGLRTNSVRYQRNLNSYREGAEAFLLRHESLVELLFVDAEAEREAALEAEKEEAKKEKEDREKAESEPEKGESTEAPPPTGESRPGEGDDEVEVARKSTAVKRAMDMIMPVKEIEDVLNPKVLTRVLGSGASFFFGFFGEAMVILICMLLTLLETDRLPGRLRRVYGDEKAERILAVFQDVNKGVQRYVSLKVLVSLITAVASMVIMRLFNLNYAITFGIIIFLFNFVPYIGSVVATILPCLVAILDLEHPMMALWLALCLAGAQQLIGNIIEPRIQGKGLSISPVVIILSLGFWGWLWGISGMILAVPITVTIRIILEQFETTKRPAQMLGSD